MSIKNIHTDESTYLHNKTDDISFPLNADIIELITDLKDTLTASDSAAGVAAPQIGAAFSVFVYRTSESMEPFVMINPKIIKAADYGKPQYEMCLSYPGEIYEVQRAKRITVRFFNEQGEHLILKFRGHEAVIIQHETDHLLGLTIKDRGEQVDPDLAARLLGLNSEEKDDEEN